MDKPVWCGNAGTKSGTPTAQTVSCSTMDPSKVSAKDVSLNMLPAYPRGEAGVMDVGLTGANSSDSAAQYLKFTSQDALGKYLVAQYHIRTPQELSSCETCHR